MSDSEQRQRYDTFADRYDEFFRGRQIAKLEQLAPHLRAPAGFPSLDAGCGTGIAERLYQRPFVNLDLSRGMLGYVQRAPVQANIKALPFRDNTFELIVCISVLLDTTPMKPAIQELFRVLRPRGQLAVSVLKSEDLAHAERTLLAQTHLPIKRLDLGPDLAFLVEKP